jgi:hypothetical protein
MEKSSARPMRDRRRDVRARYVSIAFIALALATVILTRPRRVA